MGKVLNITDKLNFEEAPALQIRDEVLEIHDDAVTVIEVMQILEEGENSMDSYLRSAVLIFGEDGLERIKNMGLNFSDFSTVVSSAIDMIIGADDEEEKVGE